MSRERRWCSRAIFVLAGCSDDAPPHTCEFQFPTDLGTELGREKTCRLGRAGYLKFPPRCTRTEEPHPSGGVEITCPIEPGKWWGRHLHLPDGGIPFAKARTLADAA